jgi:hypothetical protein
MSREWPRPLQIRRQKQTGDIGRDQRHPAMSRTQAHISARTRDKHEEPAPTAFTHVACVWLLCAGRWERGRGYLRWSACAGGGAHAFAGQNCGVAGASRPAKPGSVFRFSLRDGHSSGTRIATRLKNTAKRRCGTHFWNNNHIIANQRYDVKRKVRHLRSHRSTVAPSIVSKASCPPH